ncbi:hypothetical protein M8494_16445 [Serratia ureilytica]
MLNRYPEAWWKPSPNWKRRVSRSLYDASLSGNYPVICVVLFNPTNGTCFASFGAHGLRRGAGAHGNRAAAGP